MPPAAASWKGGSGVGAPQTPAGGLRPPALPAQQLRILEVTMEIRDRRVRRTQHLLARALIALTLEKGYEAVTIRDITERADVGYATFFRHYHDKDELLKDVLDVVLTEIIDLLGSTQPAADPTTIGVLLFRYVQEQSEVIRVLLMRHTLLQRIIEIATQNVVSEHTF